MLDSIVHNHEAMIETLLRRKLDVSHAIPGYIYLIPCESCPACWCETIPTLLFYNMSSAATYSSRHPPPSCLTLTNVSWDDGNKHIFQMPRWRSYRVSITGFYSQHTQHFLPSPSLVIQGEYHTPFVFEGIVTNHQMKVLESRILHHAKCLIIQSNYLHDTIYHIWCLWITILQAACFAWKCLTGKSTFAWKCPTVNQ